MEPFWGLSERLCFELAMHSRWSRCGLGSPDIWSYSSFLGERDKEVGHLRSSQGHLHLG